MHWGNHKACLLLEFEVINWKPARNQIKSVKVMQPWFAEDLIKSSGACPYSSHKGILVLGGGERSSSSWPPYITLWCWETIVHQLRLDYEWNKNRYYSQDAVCVKRSVSHVMYKVVLTEKQQRYDSISVHHLDWRFSRIPDCVRTEDRQDMHASI